MTIVKSDVTYQGGAARPPTIARKYLHVASTAGTFAGPLHQTPLRQTPLRQTAYFP